MSIRKEPKYKVDRRLGVNLWGRPKSPYNRRETRPGEHGENNRQAVTGIIVNDGLNINRKYYKNLRGIIHRHLQVKEILDKF